MRLAGADNLLVGWPKHCRTVSLCMSELSWLIVTDLTAEGLYEVKLSSLNADKHPQ